MEAAGSSTDHAGIEHAFIRCPYEGLSHAFRSSQKLLDKEVELTLNAVKNIDNKKPGGGVTSTVTSTGSCIYNISLGTHGTSFGTKVAPGFK